MPAVAQRGEDLLGTAVVATTPVAGGDICTATRLRLSDGRSALVKTRPQAPPNFFATEAQGLEWLRAAGGAAVPEVLAVEPDCLIITWVETGRATPEAAERFGRALAATHTTGTECFGTHSGTDGYIGTLPLPNRSAETWPDFFATRRVLPYLKLANDRGGIGAADADAVEAAMHRLVDLAGPTEPPARLHGDLWSGNLLWGADGQVRVIDPAAHGGHRETDLAMLALFGCPHLARVLEAYQEAAPLAVGWEDRAPLHRLFPLLVHASLFGGAYGPRAGEAARSLI
ncbi:fructosamine kinase family protein [soil metagenome]